MWRAVFVLSFVLALSMGSADDGRASTCEPCHKDAKALKGHTPLLAAHSAQVCVDCHGGDASQADEKDAHAGPGPRELLVKSRTRASCVACHIPGAVPGMEQVVRGGEIFKDLGCYFCHTAMGFGSLEAWVMPLDVVGLKGSAYLKTALNEPWKIFGKGTKMPTFTSKFTKDPTREEALMTFLLAMRGRVPKSPAVSTKTDCASCHTAPGKPAKADTLKSHRCQFIRDAKKELNCARCHAGETEKSGTCLFIDQRRFECGSCHLGGDRGS